MKVVLCMLLLTGLSYASKITFTADPDTVIPGPTAKLTVRCSIRDAASVNIIGKRDVTTRAVAHVTSIVITRTNANSGVNETVASVTSFDPATAVVDAGKIKVNGSTNSPLSGEDGYLELSWAAPTSAQTGIYFCEAFTLNTENHPENFEAKVEVGVGSLSTADLLQYIKELQNRLTALEQQVSSSPQNQSATAIQTGNIKCLQGTHDYPVTFSPAFGQVPKVFTAVSGTSNSDGYVFTPSILGLTGNGFDLRCTSYRDTDIVWVALL